MEDRDQEISPRPRFMTAASDVTLEAAVPRPTSPAGLGRPEDRVDCRPFRRGGKRPDDVEIHRRSLVAPQGR
jgi:hypothetical protein